MIKALTNWLKTIIMMDAPAPKKPALLTDIKLPKPIPYQLPKTQLSSLYGARKGKMWHKARVK